jgi:hypothetical protein
MPNRYVCDVLGEIRTCVKVGRVDMIVGLAEELQIMVNRMEAKLADYANMGYHLDEAKELKERLKDLAKKVDVEVEKFNDLLQ